MIRNLEEDRYGIEGVADFHLMNQEIRVMMGKDVEMEYAEKCIKHLQNMPHDVIETLLAGSIRYCEDYREYFAEEGIAIPKNIKGKEILQYISAGGMSINTMPKDGIVPAFSLELSCDWEREHGMEWVIRGNEVVYIGAFNGGISPWEEEDIVGNYRGVES